ncbi:MAG: pyridoxamine 5'-phosphate oxidase family protein [Negativicutes bacterium]|nr:pyridoxamine 5'-phosphate oxidase family protein [Negativicutes bacterium]
MKNETMAMRRSDRALSQDQAIGILEQGEFGNLAMAWQNEPYTIPVNYLFADGKIYIHSAKEGKKLLWLKQNPLVCFSVSRMLQLKKADTFCAYGAFFESVIVMGHCSLLEEHPQKEDRLMQLVLKHDPAVKLPAIDEKAADQVALLEITISSISGKASYPEK